MVEINAKDVMALRNSTGLPMMDCKKALAENNGDRVAAEEWLRKKLKGKMDTRTDRAAGEGRIAVAVKGDAAVIVELRAETDFTARNENFVNAVNAIASEALSGKAGDLVVTESGTKAIDNLRISTGENVSFARARKLEAPGAKYGTYVHYDGKLGLIADDIRDLPFDGLDSLTPPPEGDLEIDRARALWPDKFFWLHPSLGWFSQPEHELQARIRALAAAAGPTRFCLQLSEEVPESWSETVPAVLRALEP